MHRAAVVVYIFAVGIDTNLITSGAEFFERIGTNLVGGAVGAIDRDFRFSIGQLRGTHDLRKTR